MTNQGDEPPKKDTKTWNSGAGGPPPSSTLQAPATPPRPATRQVLPTSTSRASLPAVTSTTELAAQRTRIEALEMQLGRANQELSGARTTIQSLFEKTETQAARIVQLEEANARLQASNMLLEKSNASLESQVGDLVVELALSENAALEATSVVLTDMDRHKTRETVVVEEDVHVDGRNDEIDKRPSLTAVAASIAALLDAGAHDTDAHEPIHDQRRTMMGMVAAPPAPEETSQLPVVAPQPLPQTSRSLRHWHGAAGDTQPFGERQAPLEPLKKS